VSPVEPDLPDEADESPDGNTDHRDDQDDGGGQANRPGNAGAETRDREEYYADLRTAVSTEESVTAQRTAAAEQNASAKWSETVTESRWMWSEYQRRWPQEDRPPVDRSDDDPEVDAQVDAACDRIAVLERHKISPAMRAIEGQDPDRGLVGFEDRMKGRDRIKEKACAITESLDRTAEQAVVLIPDTLRYTFQYQEARYTQGVWMDIGRLNDQGFVLQKLRNYWSDDKYNGINSQWIEPDSGQRFEVQFHTNISFEAKQLTHLAYERLRTPQPNKPDKFEQMVLEAFEKKVTADVPVPPGAADIPDYP
jgi:hypothetical protein